MNLLLKLFQRYTPDPMVLALFLTGEVVALALALTPSDMMGVAKAWGEGFSSLLAFTMQMVLMLLGGILLAEAPWVKSALQGLARKIHTSSQAVVAVTLVSAVMCWLNWGLGLVIGAFFALSVGRRLKGNNFALLVAASYSGFLLWHGGLSGSIPLSVNTPSNPMQDLIGGLIPVTSTLFSVFNLSTLLLVLIALVLTNLWLLKFTAGPAIEIEPEGPTPVFDATTGLTPAERWERSPWPTLCLGLLGGLYLGHLWLEGEFRLDLNMVNLVLYLLAALFHGNLRSFLSALEQGASKVGPLIVQYPLYGGIMGVVSATGLGALMAKALTLWTSATTLPLATFFSAGLLNIFIPSGGGQWAVQGPIALSAAKELGADIPLTIMSVAWGDAWTNMLQPFWALPLLAIVGLKARDIMGYCVVIALVSGLVIGAGILVASNWG